MVLDIRETSPGTTGRKRVLGLCSDGTSAVVVVCGWCCAEDLESDPDLDHDSDDEDEDDEEDAQG
jgi:hypothetical protein